MVYFLRANPDCRIVLVEKTDRLYRNFRDYVTLDDLGVEIHLVKEGEILGKDSRRSCSILRRSAVNRSLWATIPSATDLAVFASSPASWPMTWTWSATNRSNSPAGTRASEQLAAPSL